MAKDILVTPEQLESTAGRIESLASEYQSEYKTLYSEVSELAAKWSGKDNIAYTNQIEGFRDDFEQMTTLMNRYAEFLRKSAKAYRDTQETITNEARKLVN